MPNAENGKRFQNNQKPNEMQIHRNYGSGIFAHPQQPSYADLNHINKTLFMAPNMN